MFATKWALRRFEKGEQHGILTLGQWDRCAGWVSELSDPSVKLPTGKSEPAAFGIAGRGGSSDVEPPQDGTDARQQFAQIEWFCQIVIRAELKTNHPID